MYLILVLTLKFDVHKLKFMKCPKMKNSAKTVSGN